MTDIEDRLRAAMHAAVDEEEASATALMSGVMRRQRTHTIRVVSVAALLLVAIAAPATFAAHGALTGSNSKPLTNQSGLPARLHGLPMPAGTDIPLLITTPTGAAWYSTATGRSRSIAGLPASQGGYQFGRLPGGWWAYANRGHGSCPSVRYECVGAQEEYYFIATGSLRATQIGRANTVAAKAAAQAGQAWLVRYPNSRDNPAATAASVQLFTTAGQALGPPIQLPVGYALYSAIGSYLLIGSYNDQPTLLWDPTTRQAVRNLSVYVLDNGPDQVAWAQDCRTCQLGVLTVSTGKILSIPVLNSHTNSPNETFCEDGKLLAVQLPNRQVAVVDTATGQMTKLAGTSLSPADFVYLDWQGSTHRLIIRAGPNTGPGPNQIAYWQPGAKSLHVATTSNASEMSAIETGTVG